MTSPSNGKASGNGMTKGRRKFLMWQASLQFTNRQLASYLKTSDSLISKLRAGSRVPGRDLAVEIEKQTEGWPGGGPIKVAEWRVADDSGIRRELI